MSKHCCAITDNAAAHVLVQVSSAAEGVPSSLIMPVTEPLPMDTNPQPFHAAGFASADSFDHDFVGRSPPAFSGCSNGRRKEQNRRALVTNTSLASRY